MKDVSDFKRSAHIEEKIWLMGSMSGKWLCGVLENGIGPEKGSTMKKQVCR